MRWALALVIVVLVAVAIWTLRPAKEDSSVPVRDAATDPSQSAAPALEEGEVARVEAVEATADLRYSVTGRVWELTLLGERLPVPEAKVTAQTLPVGWEDSEVLKIGTADFEGKFALEWLGSSRAEFNVIVSCPSSELVERGTVQLRFDSTTLTHEGVELVRRQNRLRPVGLAPCRTSLELRWSIHPARFSGSADSCYTPHASVLAHG
jgi:hypothetical protein